MSMIPLPYRVASRRVETSDTVSLLLAPVRESIAAPLPGQFTMVYAFGVGEVPVSVSAQEDTGTIVHTLRAVGAVTRALYHLHAGDVLGIRGPYGTDWGLPAPEGSDLMIVAGGIGLAPLRPVIRHAVAQRDRYRRVSVMIGARTPHELLYLDEYDTWKAGDVDLRVTVDRAAIGWMGRVGVVTTLFGRAAADTDRTIAFVCGPDVMMRFAARELVDRGVAPRSIRMSLERNMRCGVALCGHCQLGPMIVCRDGPVVDFDYACDLLSVKEL